MVYMKKSANSARMPFVIRGVLVVVSVTEEASSLLASEL